MDESRPNKYKKAWYDTGWAWVWVLLAWPIGLYVFYKRGGGEHRWKVIAFVFVVIIGSVGSLNRSNQKISTGQVQNGVIASNTDKFGSNYTFRSSNGSYSYTVRHIDGSSGTYTLRKSGNKYFDESSKFGEYFIVTSGSISVYDSSGFIRKF